MTVAPPRYSRRQVDAAGTVFMDYRASIEELDEAFTVINNWRAMHSFPLNTFQTTLRRKAREVDEQCLVAQRIKRLSSIASKLERFPQMNLSRMQDIGGCRAVVSSVAQVKVLARLYRDSDLKHKIIRMDDYINHPKPSGYRGMHFVYRYYSDRKPTFNGLNVELQFRSKLQHAWATAVETVGTFIRQSLKASQGEEAWLRFFTLMGTEIAFREGSPAVPDTPTDRTELKSELQMYIEQLNVENRLRAFGAALSTLEPTSAPRKAHYFLLVLDPTANKVTITGYNFSQLGKASDDYMTAERASKEKGTDAVLVSVDSMDSLRRAYPNYFLDTNAFIDAVRAAVS